MVYLSRLIFSCGIQIFECGTPAIWRHHYAKRRHFDAITSKWRRFDVITTLLLHHVFGGMSSGGFSRRINSGTMSPVSDRYLFEDRHPLISYADARALNEWPCHCRLWPNDAIWRHRSVSTLAQVMACCLMAPSHYLNPCWLSIGEVGRQLHGRKFTANTQTAILCNEFESYYIVVNATA